jgi:hypothetical protein
MSLNNHDSASRRVVAHLDTIIDQGSAGDRLPSVRALRAELGVSPATVRAAVSELVRAERIETISGSGTFILEMPRPQSDDGDRVWQTAALSPHHLDIDFPGPLQSAGSPDTIDLAKGSNHSDHGLPPNCIRSANMTCSLPLAARPRSGSAAECVGEAPRVGNADPQRRVWAEANDLRNALDELDAEPSMMVCPKGETVVSETQPRTNRCVPAMWARDLGVVDVRQWRLRRQEPERGSQRATAVGIASQRDTVVGADAHRSEQWRPTLVESVRKEVAHSQILPAECSVYARWRSDCRQVNPG